MIYDEQRVNEAPAECPAGPDRLHRRGAAPKPIGGFPADMLKMPADLVSRGQCRLETLLIEAVGLLSSTTEAISAFLIAVGVAHAAALTIAIPFGGGTDDDLRRLDPRENIRLKLGRWLALALEFQLAADILKTAVAPTWDDIGKVAAIIVLRTLLNFFLAREIALAERQLADHP